MVLAQQYRLEILKHEDFVTFEELRVAITEVLNTRFSIVRMTPTIVSHFWKSAREGFTSTRLYCNENVPAQELLPALARLLGALVLKKDEPMAQYVEFFDRDSHGLLEFSRAFADHFALPDSLLAKHAQLSDKEIAQRIGVSQEFVSNRRKIFAEGRG